MFPDASIFKVTGCPIGQVPSHEALKEVVAAGGSLGFAGAIVVVGVIWFGLGLFVFGTVVAALAVGLILCRALFCCQVLSGSFAHHRWSAQ